MAIDPYSGVIAWNSFEGGTDGTTVTTGNSGGASGTAFSGIQVVGTGSAAFESSGPIHDAMSLLITAIGGTTMVRWDAAVVGSRTELYGVAYMKWGAFPASYSTIIEAKQTDGGSLSFRIKINNTGQLRLTDSADATVWSAAASLSLNTVYRVEWHINCTTGAYDVWWYLGDSNTAVDTRTGTGSFGATIAQVNHGRTSTPDHITTYDTLALATTKLGPRAAAGTSSLPASVVSNAGAWTGTGGTTLAVVRDGSDATYVSTPASPTNAAIRYKMQPLANTDAVSVTTRGAKSDATQNIDRTVSIYNGATLLITDTWSLTTTPTNRVTTTPGNVTAGVELEVLISDDVV